MSTLLASGAFVLALAGGVIAVDDRYTTKAEFFQLVAGVKELAGSVKEFRLESRLESLQAERRVLPAPVRPVRHHSVCFAIGVEGPPMVNRSL